MNQKYSEDEILKEVSDYISNTYKGHYSVGNVQTLDLIDSVGDAEAFCRSNILKYASRYDRKQQGKTLSRSFTTQCCYSTSMTKLLLQQHQQHQIQPHFQ